MLCSCPAAWPFHDRMSEQPSDNRHGDRETVSESGDRNKERDGDGIRDGDRDRKETEAQQTNTIIGSMEEIDMDQITVLTDNGNEVILSIRDSELDFETDSGWETWCLWNIQARS